MGAGPTRGHTAAVRTAGLAAPAWHAPHRAALQNGPQRTIHSFPGFMWAFVWNPVSRHSTGVAYVKSKSVYKSVPKSKVSTLTRLPHKYEGGLRLVGSPCRTGRAPGVLRLELLDEDAAW